MKCPECGENMTLREHGTMGQFLTWVCFGCGNKRV